MSKNRPIRVIDGTMQPYEAFWEWKPANASQDAELSFYGYISEFSWLEDAVTPRKFAKDLKTFGNGKAITIRMNSGGGELFAAHAIAGMLRDYPGKKTVIIDGLCASAAVMVALSADKVKIQDAAYMMIHNPGYAGLWDWLDAETLRKFADMLDVFREGMLDGYANRTELSREELQQMLDAETWMTAAQAVELGFADEVLTGSAKAGARAQNVSAALMNYVNVPGELLNFTSEVEPDAAVLEKEREAQSLRDYVDLFLHKEQG